MSFVVDHVVPLIKGARDDKWHEVMRQSFDAAGRSTDLEARAWDDDPVTRHEGGDSDEVDRGESSSDSDQPEDSPLAAGMFPPGGLLSRELLDGFIKDFGSVIGTTDRSILGDPTFEKISTSGQEQLARVAIPDHFLDGIGESAPMRTADATERMATRVEGLHQATVDLVALTGTNLTLAKEQRESAERTERFTRRMTWVSLIVSVASLGAAVTSIFLAVILTK